MTETTEMILDMHFLNAETAIDATSDHVHPAEMITDMKMIEDVTWDIPFAVLPNVTDTGRDNQKMTSRFEHQVHQVLASHRLSVNRTLRHHSHAPTDLRAHAMTKASAVQAASNGIGHMALGAVASLRNQHLTSAISYNARSVAVRQSNSRA